MKWAGPFVRNASIGLHGYTQWRGCHGDGYNAERDARLRPPIRMEESAANGKAAVPAPLPVLRRNAAADLRKMRRIIAEDCDWSLAIVPLLSDLCLLHIVHHFQSNPVLDKLLPKHKAKVLELLPTSLPLQVSAGLIGCEEYWKRCAAARWPVWDVTRGSVCDVTRGSVCDVAHYGSSWKRLFFERHLEDLIERFIPDLTDARTICETAALSKDYVRRLDLQQLLPPVRLEGKREEEAEDEASDTGSEAGGDFPSMDHFDFNLIANSLSGLEELRLFYGVRGCGMNFQWNLFRFTERDCSLLANTFSTFTNLKVFRLLKSKVDDDKVRVLVRSFLDHPSLLHLDLSHNLLSDRGARAIGKLLNRSRLQILTLTNNKVRPAGAQAHAGALSRNCTLNTLSLRLNQLRDAGGQALCNALLHNSSLETLHLGSNQLTESTASALSQVLTQNRSLRSLSLTSNCIGLAGGKLLLEGMSENKTLLEMDLRLTEVGQESEFFITQVLRSNQERHRGPPHANNLE